MNMHDPNLGARIQAEGMRINAQAGAHGRHGRRSRGPSVKSRLFVLVVMIAALVAVVMWLSSGLSSG